MQWFAAEACRLCIDDVNSAEMMAFVACRYIFLNKNAGVDLLELMMFFGGLSYISCDLQCHSVVSLGSSNMYWS